MKFVSESRKFLAASGAMVAALVTAGVVPGSAGEYIAGVIGAVGVALVYYLPNDSDDHASKHAAE